MNRIRTLMHGPSGLHRLLLTFATALLVIVGLLAMHTLAGSLTAGHPDIPTAAVEPAPDPTMAIAAETTGMLEPATRTGAEDTAGHCAGDCGSGGMPDHSVLMMACVLALLAVAIVLLAPVLLASLGAALALLRLHARSVRAALPHPRPPSLLVLSISRT